MSSLKVQHCSSPSGWQTACPWKSFIDYKKKKNKLKGKSIGLQMSRKEKTNWLLASSVILKNGMKRSTIFQWEKNIWLIRISPIL